MTTNFNVKLDLSQTGVLQANAAIIAGVLVMTTLANFGREVSSNSLAVSAFLVVLIVPFSVSSLFALFGNMKRAVIFMAMGFVSLIVAVAVGFYALDLWLYYGPK